MPAWIRDASSWKLVLGLWVRDGGVWKPVQGGWVRDGGAWKLFFSAGTVQHSNVDIRGSGSGPGPGTAIASVTFQSNGITNAQATPTEVVKTHPIPGQWWSSEPDAGVGNNFDVRCAAINSGSFSTAAAAVGTWITMNSDRGWFNSRSSASPGSSSVNADFEIRPAGGGSVLAAFNVILAATWST